MSSTDRASLYIIPLQAVYVRFGCAEEDGLSDLMGVSPKLEPSGATWGSIDKNTGIMNRCSRGQNPV